MLKIVRVIGSLRCELLPSFERKFRVSGELTYNNATMFTYYIFVTQLISTQLSTANLEQFRAVIHG